MHPGGHDAARRAAQAAAAAPAADKAARGSLKQSANGQAKEPSTITSKIRSLLVGASVVVIVLGTFKMAMTLLDGGSPPPSPPMENSSEPSPSSQPPANDSAKPAMPDPVAPSMTSPTPLGVPGASDATALFILLTIGASRVAGPAASGVSTTGASASAARNPGHGIRGEDRAR